MCCGMFVRCIRPEFTGCICGAYWLRAVAGPERLRTARAANPHVNRDDLIREAAAVRATMFAGPADGKSFVCHGYQGFTVMNCGYCVGPSTREITSCDST